MIFFIVSSFGLGISVKMVLWKEFESATSVSIFLFECFDCDWPKIFMKNGKVLQILTVLSYSSLNFYGVFCDVGCYIPCNENQA